MKRLIILSLFASAYIFSASEHTPLLASNSSIQADTPEYQSLIKELTKDEILTQIKQAEITMDLSVSSPEEMESELEAPHLFDIFLAHTHPTERKEQLLIRAAQARANEWGQGYVDAIDELFNKTPGSCCVQ